MSQNVWATIMPFGPVINFLLAQKKKKIGPAIGTENESKFGIFTTKIT